MAEDKQIINPAASSQQSTDDAQAIFDKGVQLYLAGQHGEALSPFKETVDSYPSAALFLGRMHEIGYGVKVDFKQSAAFYKKAALGFFHALVEQGDAEALPDLVSYY